MHYADGETRELPIVYGQDIRDWHSAGEHGKMSRASTVWRGRNAAGADIRLGRNIRQNPRPDVQIERLDIVSSMSAAAPFIVAISLDPWCDP